MLTQFEENRKFEERKVLSHRVVFSLKHKYKFNIERHSVLLESHQSNSSRPRLQIKIKKLLPAPPIHWVILLIMLIIICICIFFHVPRI